MAIAPDTRAQAVALSEAGFTTATIAERLGISVSSVKRIRQAHGVTKGAASAELVEAARSELARAFDVDYIRSQAAALIIDELALCHELRGRLQAAMASAPAPTDLKEWGIYLRGLTAASTALKNTSDTLHKTLGSDNKDSDEALPELVVNVISPKEIEALQDKQAEQIEAFTDPADQSDDDDTDGVVELH